MSQTARNSNNIQDNDIVYGAGMTLTF